MSRRSLWNESPKKDVVDQSQVTEVSRDVRLPEEATQTFIWLHRGELTDSFTRTLRPTDQLRCDVTSPKLQSWLLGLIEGAVSPETPSLIHFSEYILVYDPRYK